MNLIHRWYCKSEKWNELMVGGILPDVLAGVDLSGEVLEIGPGPGLVTKALLAYGVDHLTSVEIEPDAAQHLRETYGDRITVHHGDAAAMPLDDDQFDTAVCCTMLHHVPTAEQQDAILAEVRRVLRPGGLLTGSDSKTSPRFRFFHLFDTHNPIEVSGFAARLENAGFRDVHVDDQPGRFLFRAFA